MRRAQTEKTIAHSLKAKCKKKSGDAKKKCLKKAKQHNATHTAPPPPPPPATSTVYADAQCLGGTSFSGVDDGERWAQTFTVQRSGSLVSGQLTFNIAAGTTGNLVAALHTVDGAGIPTNIVLRSAAVATEALAPGEQLVTFAFGPSLPVTVGTKLALVFSHSGDQDPGVKRHTVAACAGDVYRSSGAATPFMLEPSRDFVYTIFVFA